MLLMSVLVDAVEKAPKRFAANLPPKDETSDDSSSYAIRPVAEHTGQFIAL
jgi:hypothetical protein